MSEKKNNQIQFTLNSDYMRDFCDNKSPEHILVTAFFDQVGDEGVWELNEEGYIQISSDILFRMLLSIEGEELTDLDGWEDSKKKWVNPTTGEWNAPYSHQYEFCTDEAIELVQLWNQFNTPKEGEMDVRIYLKCF